jgi:hypothetical protein
MNGNNVPYGPPHRRLDHIRDAVSLCTGVDRRDAAPGPAPKGRNRLHRRDLPASHRRSGMRLVSEYGQYYGAGSVTTGPEPRGKSVSLLTSAA